MSKICKYNIYGAQIEFLIATIFYFCNRKILLPWASANAAIPRQLLG